MRRLAIAVCVAVAGLGATASPASSDRSARPTGCMPPHYRGVFYTGPYTFTTARFRVGRPLGTVAIPTVCKDYGSPSDPPRVEYRSVRVYRLKGFNPKVALSVGGSSREILIRALPRPACIPGDVVTESQILRCLRRLR
jgi:hypothetical protein